MELWFTEKHSPNAGITLRIKRCILQKKTRYQQLDILESHEYGKILLLDGLIMFTERDEFIYHEMIVHVPLIIHPDPKKILVIGGGDGGTVREILKHPGVERIDLVEIDEDVINTCIAYFPEVSHGLKNPKVRILVEDGIEFMKKLDDRYDIIIIDSTDPIGPAKGLFEQKFYQNVDHGLEPEGIMVSQSESPFQDTKLWSWIYKNISSVFEKTFSYLAFIPTYPAGFWSFTLASKDRDPTKEIRREQAQKLSSSTRYYNLEIHRSAFSLPNFLKSELSKLP